jgi:hypothetical protein
MSRGADRVEDRRLEREAGVIAADRDDHGADATRFATVRS